MSVERSLSVTIREKGDAKQLTIGLQWIKILSKAIVMQTYSLPHSANIPPDALAQAQQEPVLLHSESAQSYVILKASEYQHMVDRLTILEDQAFGEMATIVAQVSPRVGSETFTATLERLASYEESEL
jgi:PHD/YefM family antitoxin component YafN of YafNO toxin-antitoxin module